MFFDSLQKLIEYLITEDCINCGACSTVCPSGAIYPGRKDFKINGVKQKAKVKDHFFIVPEKCNNCDGFYDLPLQCALWISSSSMRM